MARPRKGEPSLNELITMPRTTCDEIEQLRDYLLDNPQVLAAYLREALETGNQAFIVSAIKTVAQRLARRTV